MQYSVKYNMAHEQIDTHFRMFFFNAAVIPTVTNKLTMSFISLLPTKLNQKHNRPKWALSKERNAQFVLVTSLVLQLKRLQRSCNMHESRSLHVTGT